MAERFEIEGVLIRQSSIINHEFRIALRATRHKKGRC